MAILKLATHFPVSSSIINNKTHITIYIIKKNIMQEFDASCTVKYEEKDKFLNLICNKYIFLIR